jgi:hypothetical protein
LAHGMWSGRLPVPVLVAALPLTALSAHFRPCSDSTRARPRLAPAALLLTFSPLPCGTSRGGFLT